MHKTGEVVREGGCLCGFIRYQIVGVPKSVGHCHCQLCQRSTGAPFVSWATYAIAQLTFIKGEPAVFTSSAKGERTFCRHCGTALTFTHQDYSNEIDVTVCSMDCPDDIAPEYHIWTMSQRSWIHLNDDLPRYLDAGPDIPSNCP